MCFSVVDSRVNEEVLGNPLSYADAFRKLMEFGLADFFAAEGFETKSQEPTLKFSALFQGLIRFDAKPPGNLLTSTFPIHFLKSLEFRFGDELEVAEAVTNETSFQFRGGSVRFTAEIVLASTISISDDLQTI